MMSRRAAKCLVALACSLAAIGMASAQSHMVNYRGQPQEDLTCMQASTTGSSGVVYRNDPSTNCFGFPSLQFDTAPVEGGVPNGMTIDWSLMVDELQMQDDDRLHFHLPGFTGAHNTFGIMGSAIDDGVNGNTYTPNFESLLVTGDLSPRASNPLAHRADFGALVGIWGISCGTEKNLYMDRAKVDNLLTAEWDPSREMLKVVVKGQRYGPTTGRHDGYVGSRSAEFSPLLTGTPAWVGTTTTQGLAVPFSASTTDPSVDKVYNYAVPATSANDPVQAITINDQSLRGHHMQAMEYAGEGPRHGTLGSDLAGTTTATATAGTTTTGYKNDGYIYAPGNRACGIYIDPTKLHRGQVASAITNGLGPLPPYGGIGKNWYKLAYMRRFVNSLCQGGVTNAAGDFTRPGMNPETCNLQNSRNLALFWQVPFDGDTERVVGYQFTTTRQMLPVAGAGAKPAGTLQAPTFSYARIRGSTNGRGSANCITVSLIPSVTIMSGSSSSQITLKGLVGSGTSDSTALPLFANSGCTNNFATLAGSNGQPTMSGAPLASGAHLDTTTTALRQRYRPFGRAARTSANGFVRQLATTGATNAGSNGYYDDADWHTRARSGTTTAITSGSPNQDTVTASTLTARAVISSKLQSPVSTAPAGDFNKNAGTLIVDISPGYFLAAGELLVFSMSLQNGNTVQDSQDVTVSASGTYCDSDNGFCDGVADKSLAIENVPMSSAGRILESRLPYFRDRTIFQSSSDPDDLTTLFVTLRTNVGLRQPDATSDSKITISGLCGFETGTDITLYQNQKSGGMHRDSAWPTEAVQSVNELPGLATSNNGIINSQASFSADGTLTIDLGTTGLVAETRYAFAFQMQTKKVANAACTPKISSSGGSETILPQDMDAVNVGLVMQPMFTTVKIGQVTTRPAVTNYLCVTLQHNYQFYSDAVVNQAQGATGNYVESKITISGLTGTQAVSTTGTASRGYALSYCPTELPYFDDKTTQHTSTQFQPDVTAFTPRRFKTFQTSCFGDSLATQSCVPGNPYVPDDAFDTKPAGRSWFGGQSIDKDSFTWDQASGTAVLTVDSDITKERMTEPQTTVGGIPKNAEIVFALPLQNGETASDCKTVSFEASGRITQKTTMVQTRTGRAIQDGENRGDACALKVYEPGFLVKKITQSTAATGDDNTLTVSIRSNVDLSSVASGQASFITISGLTGTATANGNLGVTAPAWRFSPRFEGGEGPWVQGTGTLTLKLDARGACVPPTVWAAGQFYDGTSTKTAPFALGGSDTVSTGIQTSTYSSTAGTRLTDQVAGYMTGGKVGTTMPSNCIKAGFLYVFSFQVTNPSAEQAAPEVMIEGKYRDSDNTEKLIAKRAMSPPISDDSEKQAMYVSDQLLTTYKIGQLIPAPGSINVICVTLTTSKDIKSQPNAPLSSITITGLTGFDASAQDLQLFRNDGVTTVTTAGGNPATDNYQVGGIFSSSNAASESSATTSGRGWARYDGKDTGNVVLWVQGETAVSSIFSYVQSNVDHKFCFRLKNPKTEMACKDVSVVVNNKGTVSSVKAVQDTTNTIEFYKFGSTCAGYVAPPNFVVKNWRSSSNTTSTTAIIHLELASNMVLETGDTITVSGLTSYTRACPTPPCDVGIDVTRLSVSHLHGKPYINGVRNVRGYGVSDAGASAAERATFAQTIQSIDLSGENDDGSFTSTFGTDAAWGKVGDTEASASTLTLTVAKSTSMAAADISSTISDRSAPSQATVYELVFALQNKAAAAADAPTISINIGQGQTQYVSLPVNTGKEQPKMGISKVINGGMEVMYTPMKTLFGGESLILTLPKFTRDSNGMLFGVTSAPNDAFQTYASQQDWKAYGTDQSYARAFFTNGWVADGVSAKSGDSGQTGERWNYPNVNAKVTTDADYSHDTGVLVLDINDPGVGQNKNYWYAATEDNLYEGRVTRAANLGAARTVYSGAIERNQIPLRVTATGQTQTGAVGNSATVDYYLDNGEELRPVRAFVFSGEPTNLNGAVLPSNGFTRGASYMPLPSASTAPNTGEIFDFATTNIYPAPIPGTVDTMADDLVGTPPFVGIPAKYQPSRRDNFYKGMLMKCWVGTVAVGGRLPYASSVATGPDNYLVSGTTQKELLPPPEFSTETTFGTKLTPTTDFAPWLKSSTADAPAVTLVGRQASIVADDLTNARVITKADVSRTLETRVIQASYRQIDYIPRKLGGCRFSGTLQKGRVVNTGTTVKATVGTTNFPNQIDYDGPVGNGFLAGQSIFSNDANTNTLTAATTTVLTTENNIAASFTDNTWIFAMDQPSTLGAVGCQDEVPGYPAVVRLESPFSRPLDPDTLCYIQRKADVGVYTGMTAMVGDREYSIKQGAANIYTVGHVAGEMTGVNGDPVDRAVPRSYSTENTLPTTGLRTTAFFSDGVGLSGQPYTIYSQLELVAKEGSKVSAGETITVTIPSASGIMPPAGDLSARVTPVNLVDTLADKVRISHVLLVPLSPACSIVAGYGVASGCQDNNGKGGVFDLILSNKWPYAYTSANENDLNGYPMTVFGGQATVIKTMADKYSQNLPYKPLQGLNSGTGTTTPSFSGAAVLDAFADPKWFDTQTGLALNEVGGRAQTGTAAGTTGTRTQQQAADELSGPNNANSQIDATFTVAKELDLLTLTGGSLRADAQKTPMMPNAPITVTDGACGSKVSDTLGPSTLPYAVCLSLAGSLAHNQGLTPYDSVLDRFTVSTTAGSTSLTALTSTELKNAAATKVQKVSAASMVFSAKYPTLTLTTDAAGTALMRPGMLLVLDPALQTQVIVRVDAVLSASTATVTKILPRSAVTTVANSATDINIVFAGPKMDANDKIVDGVQRITGAVGQEAAAVMPGPINDNYSKMGSMRPVPNYGTRAGYYENPADNLGLGAYIVVGVYNNGTSDRFVYSTQNNKGTINLALPIYTDMERNLVIQRYLGTSRTGMPLSSIPAGLIGGDNANKPTAGFPKPAGQVPRYQARVAAGYAIGRFSFGVDSIMQVRSDLTSGAYPTGMGYSPYGTALNAYTPGEDVDSATTPAVDSLRAPFTVSPVNMDGALPMSPASMSSDMSQQFMSDRRSHAATTPTSRLLDESLSPMNRHPSGHSLEVTAPSTMQKIRYGRSSLPLPQVFHTASHQASSVSAANRLTRGHCGLLGANDVTTTGVSGLMTRPVVPTRVNPSATAGQTQEMCQNWVGTEFNPDLPFSRNVYIEQGMDVYLVSSLFDSLIQRPEPPRKNANDRTDEGRTQLGCGTGTGFFAGADQNPVAFFDGLRKTTLSLNANLADLTTTTITLTAAPTINTPQVVVGDIIFFAATGAADPSTVVASGAGGTATATAREAMLVTAVPTSTTLTVERGVLGTPRLATAAATNVIFVLKCGGGAFPTATSPPVLKRSVGRGTHATDNEVLGNLQTQGTRVRRTSASGIPAANYKGMVTDAPMSAANHNYGFDVDTRLYSVLGPFMRPAVIRDVVDSGSVRNVKASKFPGVLTISNPNDAGYLPRGSNVANDHGVRLSATLNADSAAAAAIVLSAATDRMQDKGCSADQPCIVSVAGVTSGARSEVFMQVTGVTMASGSTTPTLAVTRPIPNMIDVALKAGEVVTYYPGYKLIDAQPGTFTAANAVPGVGGDVSTVVGSATGTVLKLDSRIDGLDNLALPFFIKIKTEFMQVTKVYMDAAAGTLLGGDMLSVVRGALGSTALANIAATDRILLVKLPIEDRSNNVKYSLAPITGTTFATVNARNTEYNTYQETDKIITFCNPLQSDLNNAPGKAISSHISDDVVTLSTTSNTNHGSSAGTAAANTVTSALTRSSATDTTFASTNGNAATAPSQWTVPRRHHLCRKLITGAPEVSTVDVASDVYATNNGAMYARSLYTESIQMNTVLNQDPSPNMRAMVTFVEPTMMPVDLAPPPAPVAPPPPPPAPVDTPSPSPYDPTGAIVGGVLGGFFGLLLIGLLIWYLCCRKPEPEPVGRAVAMERAVAADKPLAPVYLPQPYPSLPEQYMPAPMPAYPATEVVQPTGQPMLYSSYQGAPVMEAYPPQPGAYPAPYGVVPQPAYGAPGYGI